MEAVIDPLKFGIGQSVPRTEDPRLVTGGGRFTDDVNLPDQLHAAVARSPYAHGEIRRVDKSAAQAAPGVVAVYTGDDLSELGGLPCRAKLTGADGQPAFIPYRPVLARGRVRFVGEPVAAVVAQTRAQAVAAAELVELEVDDLPAVVDLADARGPDACVLHPERGSNLCLRYENGDGAATRAALEAAPHRVTLDLVNNRVAPTPLEPRACVGAFEDGRFTLYNPSQGAFAQQGVLAKAIFGVPPEQVRVISGDTGGGFGIRGEVYAEACVCLFAARALGRPVKWRGDRSEMFLSDSHGRDNLTRCELGLDDDGRVLALVVETLANLGAYCSAVGPLVPTVAGGRVVGTVYRIPVLHHRVDCLFTNVMPVSAYRGAGRPEACYVVERLMDAAAERLGLGRDEIRRRNFVTPAELPYTNHAGVTMASGDFPGTMDLALERADWWGFPQRREAAAQQDGRLRGIGLGYYVESSGGGPEEEARITLRSDGGADVVVGTYSHGQGHETAYAQILADRLGLDFQRIRIIQGDTEQVKFGGGTGGSRSSQMGGIAVMRAGVAVAEEGRPLAAELLQAPVDRVRFEAGLYRVDDGSREVPLAEVAKAAAQAPLGQHLSAVVRYDRGGGYTFPNGCHVAEVAVDPETGVVEVLRYTAVDDCGQVINPLLATGQVRGGVVQGLGQALLEQVVYDETGQLVTGSFTDYAMPSFVNMPDMDVSFNEVAEPTNDLGVKGIGEGGACASPHAVVNAVLDALASAGVPESRRLALQMPLTPEKVWRCLGGN